MSSRQRIRQAGKRRVAPAVILDRDDVRGIRSSENRALVGDRNAQVRLQRKNGNRASRPVGAGCGSKRHRNRDVRRSRDCVSGAVNIGSGASAGISCPTLVERREAGLSKVAPNRFDRINEFIDSGWHVQFRYRPRSAIARYERSYGISLVGP